MKIKHIILIALTALALGLASLGVGAPALASIKGGATGDFEAKIGAPALAGSKPGLLSGSNAAPEPDVASIKPGTGDFEAEVAAPRFTVDGGMSGGVLGK